MSQHVVVFDLETIPCADTLARLHGRETCSDDEAAEILGEKFPKLPLHKVAVLAALVAERVEGVWRIKSLGAPHIGERSEVDLISAFAARVDALRPTLVTFNGNGFDLPVLRYRAMVNGIAAPGLTSRPYFRRYITRLLCIALSRRTLCLPNPREPQTAGGSIVLNPRGHVAALLAADDGLFLRAEHLHQKLARERLIVPATEVDLEGLEAERDVILRRHRQAEAHEPTLQQSEHMPPPGPAPVQARKPSTPKPARKKKPISAAELVHFSFGGRSKDRVLDDLEPIVWKLAENGFRKPADVARLLNKQGVKTACGEQWSTQLVWRLLDLLFERRRQRRAARPSEAPAAPRAPSTSKAPLSSEEIARRLSALGRVARSD